ncbi:MAG: glycosyltransferase family 4 protein [bacterium]
MNILFISTFCSFWSMGKNKGAVSYFNLIENLVKKGHKVFLLKPEGEKEEINIKYFEIKNPFTKPNKGYISNFLFSILFFKRTIFLGRKIIKQHNIDSIVGISCLSGLVAYFLGKMFKKPSFTHLYGIHDFKISCFFSPLQILAYFDIYLNFKFFRNKIIFIDDFTSGEKLREKFKIPFCEWISIPLGTNKEWFNQEIKKDLKDNFKIPKNTIILISVSRLSHEKRISLIIEAIPKVIEKYFDVCFLILGDGPEKEKLQQKAKKLKVENFIKFIGAVDQSEVNYYLKNSDIFLSFYKADIGGSLMEAMICGLPCIVTRRGEIDRIIKNNETGLIVEENFSIALSIISLLENFQLRKKLGENSINFAQKNFLSWTECIDREINVLIGK